MRTENPRRGKLAQLMPNHAFMDVDWNEFVSIVHRKSVTDEIGCDR